MQIPHIETSVSPSGASVASAALSLVAVDIDRSNTSGRNEVLGELHRSTDRLLRLLSLHSDPLIYDLHMVSRPSLDLASTNSRLDLTFQVHALGNCTDHAIESCLAHLVVLQPLLTLTWPHTEFETVRTAADYRGRVCPFIPSSSVRVHRVLRDVSLSDPFTTRTAVPGFLSSERPERASSIASHLYPWTPNWDDWTSLITLLQNFPSPQWIRFRVANGAQPGTSLEVLSDALRRCESQIYAAASDEIPLMAHLQMLRQVCVVQMRRLQLYPVRGEVVVFSPGGTDDVVANFLGQTITGDNSNVNTTFEGGFGISARSASSDVDSFEEAAFSCAEAACYFRVPILFSDAAAGLPVRRSRVMPLTIPSAIWKGDAVTRLGLNVARGTEREISVPLSHRFKHIFLIGMTGSGKSTAMLSMMLQDLRQGHGLCLIDPHGDLADDLLRRFPDERSDDLVIMDLADRTRPVPLNFLAWSDLEERDLVIDELLSCLLRTYHDPAMFGPVFEMNFRTMLKILMGDKTRPEGPYTLLEFQLLFQNSSFRKHLLESMTDDHVSDALREGDRVLYGDSKPENLAPYVTSKIARFVHDSLLRRIVGHGRLGLNMSTVMEKQSVVVVKLGRGRFGNSVADLITTQLLLRFRMAAMRRNGQSESERKPFFLYIDEVGTLARDETFAALLAEARKFRLGLVLATQYAAQLRDADPNRNILSAVLGNVGTIASYRVGVEDAVLLAPVFAPFISPQDLVECPNYQGYMRIHPDRVLVRPFSFSNVPDPTVPDEERRLRLIEQSRLRHGVSEEECDSNAQRRRRFIAQLG